MKKLVGLFLCFVFLPLAPVSAENYESSNFTLTTDLDSQYAKLIVKKIEAFYSAVSKEFALAPCQSLHIYYSKTQADTQKLLDQYGHKVKVRCAYFTPETSAVYAHQYLDDGQPCGIDAVFNEISQSIVACNFENCPPWFCQGLASFIGEERHVVKDRLTAVEPNPWRRTDFKRQNRNNDKAEHKTPLPDFYHRAIQQLGYRPPLRKGFVLVA